MLTFKTLENTKPSIIVDTLLTAFEGYFVKMPTSVEYWKSNWQNNRVRFDLSFGAFEDNQLVAFMVNGIDTRNNQLIAFNAGTGVIPSYRRQKMVKQLYNFAFPILKNNGIENFALEVVAQNIKAIKAYQSVGFKIDKLFQCFRIDFTKNNASRNIDHYTFENKATANWDLYKPFQKGFYCWGNTINAIKLNSKSYKYVNIYNHNNQLMAYYIISPSNNTLAQFEAKNDEAYQALFHHWQTTFENIRVLNICDTDKINFLTDNNFDNYINQFEMIL